MFPTRNPLLYILTTVGIIALIGVCMVVLGNPLALLALLLLPQVQLVHDPETMAALQGGPGGGDYDDSTAGFTARM